MKRAALFAEIYNRLRGARADSGYLLKLFHRRGVQLDRMSGRVLRIRARPRRGKKNQQNRDAVQCAPNSIYFIHNARIGYCQSQIRKKTGEYRISNASSLRVVFGDRAEESGLLGDLGAVADEDDLLVGGIEMAAGGG